MEEIDDDNIQPNSPTDGVSWNGHHPDFQNLLHWTKEQWLEYHKQVKQWLEYHKQVKQWLEYHKQKEEQRLREKEEHRRKLRNKRDKDELFQAVENYWTSYEEARKAEETVRAKRDQIESEKIALRNQRLKEIQTDIQAELFQAVENYWKSYAAKLEKITADKEARKAEETERAKRDQIESEKIALRLKKSQQVENNWKSCAANYKLERIKKDEEARKAEKEKSILTQEQEEKDRANFEEIERVLKDQIGKDFKLFDKMK